MLRAISNFFAAVNTWTQKNIFNPGPVLIGTATDDGVNKLQVNGTLAFGTANDAILQRDAANTLAQRNGTAAQGFRLYNTFTDASNYERVEFGAGILGIGANTFAIGNTNAGTGSARDFYIQSSSRILFQTAGPTNRWMIDATGFVALTDNVSDIGASGANRPRTGYFGTSVLVAGPGGVGYTTGAGGTVTQLTNKSTGVTLNTITGEITMNAAALAANTTVSFTLTNSTIAATDLVLITHDSAGTAGAYTVTAQSAAGTANIAVRNVTAGSLSEAIVLKFAVFKAVNS